MRYWFVSLCIIIALAIGFAYYEHGIAPSPQHLANHVASSTIIPGVSSLSYEDQQYGFHIEYPSNAEVVNDNFDGYLFVTKTPVVGFRFATSTFAGTNLGEAGVFIGATSSPAVVAACTQPSAQDDESATSSVSLGGMTFNAFTSTGVGAGQIYQEKILRAVVGGSCIEIVELLHSGNIGMYTPGAVTQFDYAKFQGYLDAMASTFSIGNSNSSVQ